MAEATGGVKARQQATSGHKGKVSKEREGISKGTDPDDTIVSTVNPRPVKVAD